MAFKSEKITRVTGKCRSRGTKWSDVKNRYVSSGPYSKETEIEALISFDEAGDPEVEYAFKVEMHCLNPRDLRDFFGEVASNI